MYDEAINTLKIQGSTFKTDKQANGGYTAISGTGAIDWNNGNVQQVTLNSNTTFTFTNGVIGGTYIVKAKQGTTGGYTASWPGSVKWPAGTAPTLSPTGGYVDLLSFIYDGTSFYGVAQTGYTS